MKHFRHKQTGYILRLVKAHDSFHLAQELDINTNKYLNSHYVSKGSMASFLEQHDRINVIVCDSCHADYEESETRKVESQGEVFCSSCFEEWKRYREEEEECI